MNINEFKNEFEKVIINSKFYLIKIIRNNLGKNKIRVYKKYRSQPLTVIEI